jgi:hypothetical protein
MIFGEKIELKVYVNQHDPVSDIQTPSCSSFLLCFFHELLMNCHYNIIASVLHWHVALLCKSAQFCIRLGRRVNSIHNF